MCSDYSRFFLIRQNGAMNRPSTYTHRREWRRLRARFWALRISSIYGTILISSFPKKKKNRTAAPRATTCPPRCHRSPAAPPAPCTGWSRTRAARSRPGAASWRSRSRPGLRRMSPGLCPLDNKMHLMLVGVIIVDFCVWWIFGNFIEFDVYFGGIFVHFGEESTHFGAHLIDFG